MLSLPSTVQLPFHAWASHAAAGRAVTIGQRLRPGAHACAVADGECSDSAGVHEDPDLSTLHKTFVLQEVAGEFHREGLKRLSLTIAHFHRDTEHNHDGGLALPVAAALEPTCRRIILHTEELAMPGLTRELGGRFFLNLARTTPALPCERVTCTASQVSTQLLITTDMPCLSRFLP